MALQAPPQTQPLAEDDSDDNDYEGLDSRAAVGEQSFEDETAHAEHQGEDSEAEEIAFKLKVTAVVRVAAKAKRFAMAPYQRFRRAVGAAATLDMRVHKYALHMGEGVEFTLTSLSEKNDQGRWFVPAQNFDATTRRYDLLERQPEAIVPSWQGGWCLVDELPDTDELSGIPMSDNNFASRWQGDVSVVLKHLLKKHEGELVELEGRWERGQGEVPDELFDPQFACNSEDFEFCKDCKGFGKSGDSYQHSKHALDYRAVNRMAEDNRMAKGKGKGKGKPAVGGKGQLVRTRGLPFESNILRWSRDGTWYYRAGKCLSLAHLFAKCGRLHTAAKLYEYYNLCRPIASKRPHAWSSPARQMAAIERKANTGRYGHGRAW